MAGMWCIALSRMSGIGAMSGVGAVGCCAWPDEVSCAAGMSGIPGMSCVGGDVGGSFGWSAARGALGFVTRSTVRFDFAAAAGLALVVFGAGVDFLVGGAGIRMPGIPGM
jgi:hypothetical protein